MNWLKQIMALPNSWQGVIQDTASTATLCSILTAREKFTNFHINKNGFEGFTNFRIYCSAQTHSSIDKAVKIAGIGAKNLVKIEVNDDLSINTEALEKLTKSSVDFILSDVRMPKMGGMELLKEARKQGVKTPIALYTGDCDFSEDDVFKNGGQALLDKPIDFTKMADLLDRVAKQWI